MSKNTEKDAAKVVEDAKAQIEQEKEEAPKVWLLIGSGSKFEVVNLDDCVTAPELKIGGEVVHSEFGTAELEAISSEKEHLADNAQFLHKEYVKQTKKVNDTAEIHLNDAIMTQEFFQTAICKEIQVALDNPIMQAVTDDLVNLFFPPDQSRIPPVSSRNREKAVALGKNEEAEEDKPDKKTVEPEKDPNSRRTPEKKEETGPNPEGTQDGKTGTKNKGESEGKETSKKPQSKDDKLEKGESSRTTAETKGEKRKEVDEDEKKDGKKTNKNKNKNRKNR